MIEPMPDSKHTTAGESGDDLAARVLGLATWISGGHGFIGTHLAQRLQSLGAQVSLFEGDVRQAAAVRASIEDSRPSVLFNLAARVDVRRDPALHDEMQDTIVGGALAVYEAAAGLGSKPLLLQCGTCEEYGTIPVPFREGAAPSEPVSPYSAAKLQSTRALLERAGEGTVRVVVARPFLTFGPGQRNRQLVPAAIEAALGSQLFPMTSGEQTREFNFVSDTVDGLIRAATTPAVEGSIVNIGSGDERRVVDVARLIFEVAGADTSLIQAGALPERTGEVPRFFADVTRCQQLLGHFPVVGLQEGLRRTIDWYRATQPTEGTSVDETREMKELRS